MNRIATFLSKLPLIGRLVSNYYEGAQWKWGERSMNFGALQDARLDATAMTRKELQRKSRYFEKNNSFQNRMADVFQQYTVGPGLVLVSKSDDATKYFKRWCQDSDALGIQDFCGQQSIASRNWFVDGECFLVAENVKGRLKINIVEAHRCETPPNMAGEEGKSIVDGVAIDARGSVTGYYFNVGSGQNGSVTTPQEWRFVPAEDVFHLFEPSRPGQYRGLPFITPVLNDLNDLDDLQQLVMQCAKQAAQIGNVTTNKTGELSTTDARRTLLKINSPTGGGTSVTKNANLFYNVKLGASEIALQHGDSISQFQATRPSLVEQQHWDYLTTKICIGTGISKMLVVPYSIQGTIGRGEYEISAAFFRARSRVVQKAIEWVFCKVTQWGGSFDREVLRGGFNFDDCEQITVRPPRSPNVDVGRNSKAALDELASGARSFQDWYAETGQDWREQFDKIAEEREYAASKGIILPTPQNSNEPDGDEKTSEKEIPA